MNDYVFIDFDGVILDSEERMLERKYSAGFHNHKDKNEYDKYFAYTNLHPEEWDFLSLVRRCLDILINNF